MQAGDVTRNLKRWFSSYWPYIAVLAVIIFIACIRIRLKDFPLERDEGEYAYMGQLILQGIPPYKLAYNMKLPGTYAAYAIMLSVLGETPGAIHCGLLLVNVSAIILVFMLGVRLYGRTAGVTAAACYGLLSTGQPVLGTAAHATHFVILFALAGMLCLLQALQRQQTNWLLVSGILFGIAFLMKQPGILFLLWGCLYLMIQERRRGLPWARSLMKTAFLCSGVVIPIAATCVAMWIAGVFADFWFWTFSYARAYGSMLTFGDGLHELGGTFSKIYLGSAPIWFLTMLGAVTGVWDPRRRGLGGFLPGFAIVSFASVCPGMYFRPHYFVLLLPAASLLAGLAVDSYASMLSRDSAAVRAVPGFALFVALAASAYVQRNFFFEATPEEACRQTYGYSPFVESVHIADYLKSRTAGGGRIAVLGSEPQIYFYSGRHSATGYIYMYPLLERQPYAAEMQASMIAEIEQVKPEYLVFVNILNSWMPQKPNTERMVFSWFPRYAGLFYEVDGVVEMTEPGEKKYHWGANAYLPDSPLNITIYRRKPMAQ